MPELPEVASFQHYFENTSLDKRISEVHFHRQKILKGTSPKSFAEKLEGRSFIETYRRGKYFFPRLDSGDYILIHFGMTGDFLYYKNDEDPPPYERMYFEFSNGHRLGFDDLRLFGKIRHIPDLEKYLEKINLGEDALMISKESFLESWHRSSGNLKGFLLNQKHLSGIGNLYADEICYQCQIHPGSKMKKIPEKYGEAIYVCMKEVLSAAVEALPHYKEYPPDWFWQWRKKGELAPDGKTEVTSAKIAGRTSYFFPGWQVLYE